MIGRLSQVLKYGWQHSGEMVAKHNESLFVRMRIFTDIIHCFYKYKMWSNQYLQEDFWFLRGEHNRRTVGEKYLEEGIIRDNWQKRFRSDKKLYAKYGNAKYELGFRRRRKRNKVYTKHYNAGENLFVENDVQICRQHYLQGTISIGRNVLLAKHCFIDYSGTVILKDGVRLADGCVIESHGHSFHSDWRESHNKIYQSSLIIEEDAHIGLRAIILPSCHYIGKHSRVGAGAVVTHDVPDYAIVAGVPARVIRMQENE